MVGCGILVVCGYSFVSLVLFLIYLGGILVVFVYTVSLAADPYPEALWGRVGLHFFGYIFLLISIGVMVIVEWGLIDVDFSVNTVCESSLAGGDFLGASLLYSWGGFDLLVCGWVLLLVLFVVLELTRGLFRGGLRSIRCLQGG